MPISGIHLTQALPELLGSVVMPDEPEKSRGISAELCLLGSEEFGIHLRLCVMSLKN